MLVLLTRLTELGELTVKHICRGCNCRERWFREQRCQRWSVFLLQGGKVSVKADSGKSHVRSTNHK